MLASRMTSPVQSPTVLAVDLGSSGVRTALVDLDGRVLGSALRPIAMRFAPDGTAEEDAGEIWSAFEAAVVATVREGGSAAARCVAVLCDSQYSSLVPVDDRGNPVGPLVLYLDTRAAGLLPRVTGRRPELWKLWLERHGMAAGASGAESLAHLLWFQTERPEIHARAAAYVEPMDYLTSRLTGRVTANVCTVFPFLLTDNRSGCEGGYCEEMIEATGVDPSRLPALVPPASVVGELLPEHARAFGLPRATPVFSPINDTHALTFGTASHSGTHLGVSIGTTLVPTTMLAEMRSDLSHFLLTQPASLPGLHLLMAEGGLAGKALEFVMQQLVYANDALGDHRREDAFELLEEAANGTPPGADGVVFLPWLTGIWAPAGDARARGAFLNLGLGTTRPHLVRAVLEGVACQLAWMLDPIGKLTGRRHDELVFAAGGASSDAWAQILADVTALPVRQLAEPRLANCRGSAFLAFHRLGLLGLDSIGERLVVRRRYEPRASLRGLYDELHERFVAAHERLGPLFPRS